ncbi:MAG: AI-2E family transporter, partial [Lysobacteraceae bacterium]
THVILVGVVFGVGQVLESVALTPLLVGDRIGMHPVAVIFAVMAGGQLFGFIGVLVALPVAAVAMVLLRYLYERYTASRLYGGEPGLKTPVPPADTAELASSLAGQDAAGDEPAATVPATDGANPEERPA